MGEDKIVSDLIRVLDDSLVFVRQEATTLRNEILKVDKKVDVLRFELDSIRDEKIEFSRFTNKIWLAVIGGVITIGVAGVTAFIHNLK